MSRRVHFKRISTPNLNELDNSDRIRICCLVTNGILIASALAVILSILAVYVHRSWLRLISALHSIISANVTLGFLLALSVVSILLGCIGLYTIRKRSTLTHGLQIFGLILLAMLEVGVLYGFLSHWLTNLTVGVTYAVQTFRPGLPDQQDNIAAIQRALHCCGRASYKDYYIANEEIPFNYVPFSCCDMHLHGEEACQNASATTQKGRVGRKPDFGIPSDQLIVPKHLSFGRGCHNLLHQTILPYILVLFAILLGFNLLTIITNSVYLHLTSKYEYEAIHKTDAALRGEPLTCSE
ncbi:hypothetical protein FBUS_02610 [Fasciolopsis buskii]|uniref:Tetraspanin n=1 Tax=Fasciolopsis buskii TaxID=27845 RepID=A0A8E0VD31_9TREM|nr:hypothetical protein FBUS_02610 [Fasciolopsis buski]